MIILVILGLYFMNWRVNAAADKCKTIVLDKRGKSIKASHNNIVGTVNITDAMIIEMDITIHKLHTYRGWQNVFHIGNVNHERLPGFWIGWESDKEGANNDGFHIVYGTENNWNEHYGTSRAGGAFTDNMKVHYKSYQTQNHLKIWQNGIKIYDNAYNSHPTPTGRNVYIGDPWHTPADVTISDLVIESVHECQCSVIDIDEYLSQCSNIFNATETNIDDLRDNVDTNTETIASITDNITENSNAIADIQETLAPIADNITENSNAIADIQKTLAQIADIIHQN